MTHSTKQFYDELTDDYHLIFHDWRKSMKKQANTLDALIKRYQKIPSKNLFDCSCGIGTQTIGLAELGYQVIASDLSEREIERAKNESMNIGVNIDFFVSDFREIDKNIAGTFDVIISCDNSIPHLLELDDVKITAKNLLEKLNRNGLLIITIRDYDQILMERPISALPNVITHGNIRSISFQVWDWEENNVYTTNHFTVKGIENTFETVVRNTKYRAYKREELTEIFGKIGFIGIEWIMPNESGYYQPIMIAYKG